MNPTKAPDPMATAQAQTQMNKDTAVTQQELNMVNQVTPYGTLTYNQTGASGSGTPQYTATQTLSPEQQKLLDQQNKLSSGVNDLAISQVDRLGGVLGAPLDLSNDAVEGRIIDLGRQRLDPIFADRRASMEADLLNRGINMGTEAYDKAFARFGQQENDAYNDLLLDARGQAISELLTSRNQPINEVSALMSGGQVTLPQFASTPQTGVSGVDYAGLVNANYQNEMAGRNAALGGIFGLGSAALGGWAMNNWKLPRAS